MLPAEKALAWWEFTVKLLSYGESRHSASVGDANHFKREGVSLELDRPADKAAVAAAILEEEALAPELPIAHRIRYQELAAVCSRTAFRTWKARQPELEAVTFYPFEEFLAFYGPYPHSSGSLFRVDYRRLSLLDRWSLRVEGGFALRFWRWTLRTEFRWPPGVL